jgi:squalene-hopene/tetraprenyl-beta-curcumene cyclase
MNDGNTTDSSTLTLALSHGERGRQPAWPALFAERLAAGQLEDGSWNAGGQLPSQKRPERETQEVSTMWSLVALQSYGTSAESAAERFAKAREWLGAKTDGQSTEWWAVRLLLARGSGDHAQADRLRSELLSRQHDDGGWGWLCSDESDAFGTGVALYALARDGVGPNEPTIARSRQFLMKTQQSDGSWLVKGTKKAKAQQLEPTSIYWGTCWAVIGLAETLPRK